MRKTTAWILLLVLLMALIVLAILAVHTGNRPLPSEPGSIQVVMCPACKKAFLVALQARHEPRCALYDVGEEAAGVLGAAGARVLTDDESKPAYGTPYVHAGLMHHKFCVLNETSILTGSYNPTDGGERNKNNLLLIESRTLATNYANEFRMLQGSRRGTIRHRILINGTLVENYFCPTDDCEAQVERALRASTTSIVFLTYSFTSDRLGSAVLAARDRGVLIAGICDSSQLSTYSECPRLGARTWEGTGLLHHKVFIIDNQTVVTGSYNPTASGTGRNNENVLIIHNASIAAQYYAEYARLLPSTT